MQLDKLNEVIMVGNLIVVGIVFILLFGVALIFKLLNVAPSDGNTKDYGGSNQHKEHMEVLNRQADAMHERNLYERGDSIYSSRHTDF